MTLVEAMARTAVLVISIAVVVGVAIDGLGEPQLGASVVDGHGG